VQTPTTLPVRNITCSCNICRYCTGVLYLSTLHLKERPIFVDKLREYRASSKVARYFCGECGSHILILDTAHNSWQACAGVVDRVVDPPKEPVQLEQYVQHEFIGDTTDGGLMVCLAAPQGREIPFFMQAPEGEEPVTVEPRKRLSPFLPSSGRPIPPIDPSQPAESRTTEKLFASCHCGGVQFNITRPSETSSECSSPWPDLMVPYHSGSPDNPEDIKWWLRAAGSKYLAGTCACRSCRLASGVPIQTWAFVPKVNIQKLDGSPLDFTLGSLRQHNSSPGCYRDFCDTCGATVFWHCDERPDLIDISVGILRAPEGSRAENWLEWWTKRLSFKEQALDAVLAAQLENGLPALVPPS
jgi:hypothetical protein